MAKDTFSPLPFFALRAPAFPFSSLFQTLTLRNTAEDWRLDFSHPWFRESLRLASGSLYTVLEAWLDGESEELEPRDFYSLVRYYLRISYRATPFGLFAGLGMARWASSSTIHLGERSLGRRADRLDMGWLHEYSQSLIVDPDLQPRLCFYTNNTLYASGDRWRYVEELVVNGNRRHQLTEVTRFEELDALLALARDGAKLSDLMGILLNAGHPQADSQSFIMDLVESQLLISELALPVTGPEADDFLAQRLTAMSLDSPRIKAFQGLRDLVSKATDGGLREPSFYQSVEQGARALVDSKHILQTDWALPLQGEGLPPQVLGELKRAIKVLDRLTKFSVPPEISRFAEAFVERYGENSVPLLEVLDTEKGLGYPLHAGDQGDKPLLLAGIPQALQEEQKQVRLSEWQKFLLNRTIQVLAKGQTELEISESDLDDVLGREEVPNHKLADTFYSNATLLSASLSAMESGDFTWILGATGGSSLAPILGRFTHLQPDLANAISDAHTEESQRYSGAVFAEIVHSPADRVGNVMQRAALRDYEIPILTPSSVNKDYTLSLPELLLHLDHGRLVLWSDRLQKEVIPRLSNAHNFLNNTIPMYRFLGDLQYAPVVPNVSWQWALGDMLHFMPRIRVGKVVVSPAKWNLSFEDWQKALSGNLVERLPHLPDWVLLVEGDQRLPVYMGQSLGRELLLQAAKKHGHLVVEELLETPDQLWLEGEGGRYTHQMVIPWKSKAPALKIAPARANIHAPATVNFPPGSNWLSLKIYGGFKTLDQLLSEAILPWVTALKQEGSIQGWFFLRYQDPGYHLRLRLQVSPKADQGAIWEKWATLSQAWMQEGIVRDIQVDTYRREWQRYGPATMEDCEDLFGMDSARCAQWIGLLDADEGEVYRWKLALLGMDQWYSVFGYDLAQRTAHSKAHALGFGMEYEAEKPQKKALSQQYQEVSDELEKWLNHPESLGEEVAPVWDILHAFEEQAKPLVTSILARNPPHRPDIDALLGSLIHMFVNRLLRSQPRKQEWVLYDLLHSHYRKQVALAKKKG